MIRQRHTIGTPAGRIIITASATGASVQVAFFPADNTKAPCGFLIPNASAGIVTLAIEAVATLNEESLSAVESMLAGTGEAMRAARQFADGMPELAG